MTNGFYYCFIVYCVLCILLCVLYCCFGVINDNTRAGLLCWKAEQNLDGFWNDGCTELKRAQFLQNKGTFPFFLVSLPQTLNFAAFSSAG